MPANAPSETAGNIVGAGDGAAVGARRAVAPSTSTRFTVVDSPVGGLLVTEDGAGLSRLILPALDGTVARPDKRWVRDDSRLGEVRKQLDAYFAGELTEFTVPLDVRGTPFQRRAWEALRAIPYGQTASYGQIARALGHPNAARAVGLANNRNPIAIIIPCHRVIGADGSLTGYGGGLDCKRQLLSLEAEGLARRGERLV